MPNKASLPRPKSLHKAPKATSGKAKEPMENFTPSIATIQPTLVVPIFAPITTPIAWVKVRIPALTKPIVASVVAVEDCTKSVRPAPERMALRGEPVKRESQIRRRSPAISLRLSVIRIMPIRNRPIPPPNCVITSSTVLPNIK